MQSGQTTREVAIDGHVHLTPELDFNTIARRFELHAPGAVPVCLLTESDRMDLYGSLCARAAADDASPHVVHESGVVLIPGRQVISAEGIEVLLYGSRDRTLEGKRAESVIENGLKAGAVVCLPWGFGKWLGRRRKLIGELVRHYTTELLLGDIAGRPSIWVEPLFAKSRVLRGADNLPIAQVSHTIGMFGSLLHVVERNRPIGQAVLDVLARPSENLRHFGKRKSTGEAIRDQFALRARS